MKLVEKEIVKVFSQKADCCSGSDNENIISLKIENGGISIADSFIVIETERWAVDNGDELRKLADEVDKMLEESRRE